MTAQLFEFPANRHAPARQLDKPCEILILPVVKIEHDGGIRAKRRRAYLNVKAALHRPLALPTEDEIRSYIACMTRRERAELDTLLRMETT